MLTMILTLLALGAAETGPIADEVAQDLCGAHLVVRGRPDAGSAEGGLWLEALHVEEVLRKVDVQESADGPATVLDVAGGQAVALTVPEDDPRCPSGAVCVFFLRKQLGADRFTPVTPSSTIRIDGDTATRVNGGVVLGSATALFDHLRGGGDSCVDDL